MAAPESWRTWRFLITRSCRTGPPPPRSWRLCPARRPTPPTSSRLAPASNALPTRLLGGNGGTTGWWPSSPPSEEMCPPRRSAQATSPDEAAYPGRPRPRRGRRRPDVCGRTPSPANHTRTPRPSNTRTRNAVAVLHSRQQDTAMSPSTTPALVEPGRGGPVTGAGVVPCRWRNAGRGAAPQLLTRRPIRSGASSIR
jgi:hypothetical protein